MGNDSVDRQAVLVTFANGVVVTHNTITGTARPCRQPHIVGTTGEIEGCFDDGKFVVRTFDNTSRTGYFEEEVNVAGGDADKSGAFGGHGGGDLQPVADFVSRLEGNPSSISRTSPADSINGHRMGFPAETARLGNRLVEF